MVLYKIVFFNKNPVFLYLKRNHISAFLSSACHQHVAKPHTSSVNDTEEQEFCSSDQQSVSLLQHGKKNKKIKILWAPCYFFVDPLFALITSPSSMSVLHV